MTGLNCLTRVVILLWTLSLLGCGQEREVKGDTEEIETFLARHWSDPLPSQGKPPGSYSSLEQSLGPQSCAKCHQAQWEQWRGSLHSHTMGPGIQWQLRLMGQEQGNRCLRCHAPLAEQKALVALQQGWPAAPKSAPPAHVPADLADGGLVCAACHVRNHQRFGPPPLKQVEAKTLPHGGFVASKAFEDSRFCATCHQFPEDGPRVNGKLQEDTYAQWRQSPFADKHSCQSCHMPNRQHLFRGVHDPEMVRKALQVTLEILPGSNAGEATARAVVRNSGAGHHFPTYMVPKVDVTLDLVNRQNGMTQLLTQRVIGWDVNVALTGEAFDTRIPAGEAMVITEPFSLPFAGIWDLELRIDVAPREHYERMFKESLSKAGALDAETVALLKLALVEAQSTRFEAMKVVAPVRK